MSDPLIFAAGLMMGLFSAPHCLAMCGGLIGAFSMGAGSTDWSSRAALVAKVNAGRILSYTILGLLGGLVGSLAFESLPQAQLVMRVIAGVLLLMCGCYIGGWWLGLRHVERVVGTLLVKLTKLSQLSPKAGIYAGLSWGCIPCGLVYSALSIAMTQNTVIAGGLFMLSFGLGTLPVLMAVGMMSSSLTYVLKNQWVRRGCGVLMLCYGVWTIVSAILL